MKLAIQVPNFMHPKMTAAPNIAQSRMQTAPPMAFISALFHVGSGGGRGFPEKMAAQGS